MAAIRATLGFARPGSLRVAVIADSFDGATFHRLFAFGLFVARNRLLEDKTIATIFIARKIIRRGLTTEITVNALIVNVKLTGNVIGIFI
jgi:hypothetical protein